MILVQEPRKGYAFLTEGGDIDELARTLTAGMVKHVPSPMQVGKLRGATKAFSFHWSNAQGAWSVITLRDFPWGLDGAEFILFAGAKATSPVGKSWSLAEMKYVAKKLAPHPGYAGSMEGGQARRAMERVARRFMASVDKQGGTTWRWIEGSGYTSQEAWSEAIQEDARSYGRDYGGESNIRDDEDTKVKQVKAPKKPTKVKVTKNTVTKGPVVKKFIITRKWRTRPGDAQTGLERDKRYQMQYDTQGDVLKAAKELALQFGEILRIELQAFCQGQTHLADVEPERGQPGVWRWYVAFRD